MSTAFTAESFGGPDRFTRELGFAHLIAVHRHLQITEEQRQRFVELYVTAMDAADLADDQDFREAVRSHVEFGSKVAMQSSAVNIAQRICDLAAPGQVLVSELVKSTSSVRKSRRPRAPTSRRACPTSGGCSPSGPETRRRPAIGGARRFVGIPFGSCPISAGTGARPDQPRTRNERAEALPFRYSILIGDTTCDVVAPLRTTTPKFVMWQQSWRPQGADSLRLGCTSQNSDSDEG